jgi:hypothetical protein
MPGAFCLNAGLRGTMTVDFASTQLHAFLIKGAADGPQRYQEAYHGVLDDVEQELDKAGQLGPLTLVQMQEFGVKLQLALQSSGLQEVPPKGNPTKGNTANEMSELKTRVRKLETAGGKPPDKPPDKVRQTSKLQQQGSPPVGVLAGEHAAEDAVEDTVQEEH